jgi:hypothetical protein
MHDVPPGQAAKWRPGIESRNGDFLADGGFVALPRIPCMGLLDSATPEKCISPPCFRHGWRNYCAWLSKRATVPWLNRLSISSTAQMIS